MRELDCAGEERLDKKIFIGTKHNIIPTSAPLTTMEPITPAAGLLLSLITMSVGIYFYYRPASETSAEKSSTFDKYTNSSTDRPKTPTRDSKANNNEETSEKEDPYPCGPMRVYFGSQTGTAEEFATTLVEEGQARGFDAKIVDLEDFQEEDFMEAPLNNALHMFAVATYGEGEPTDNALDFYKWLKKDVDELPETLKFCVFGLGNTQYEHFNAMGRNINKIMEKKGALRVADYGEGDDDGTMEEDFESWRDNLWPQLTKTFGGSGMSSDSSNALPKWKPSYSVRWMEATADQEKVLRMSTAARTKVIAEVVKGMSSNDPDRKIALSSQSYFVAKEARVVSNAELRKDGGTEDNGLDQDNNFGSTVQVEFDLSSCGLTYETADTLAICPENNPTVVESLCSWQDWNIDSYFLHQHASPVGQRAVRYKPLFPSPISVRDALLRYCDLTSIVRKTMLPKLAIYATSKDQQTKLLWLASTEGREAFNEEILIPGRTILEMMERFPSLKIPFVAFLEIIPRLMSRDYTISSSSVVNPNICSITCKVLRDPKENSTWETVSDSSPRMHNGICSNYLFREGSMSRVFVKKSTFKLPEDTSLPIVMIGPGTGIAPMRAFLQERKWQRETYGLDNVGETDLYFGCRRPDEDYIYEDELLSYTRDGTLTRLELGKFLFIFFYFFCTY